MSTDTPAPEGRPFDSFDLPAPVMDGIRAAGFTHCTPIQEKVLPLSLAGRDVAGQAQTGTGKTAAFLITVFTRLLRRPRTAGTQGPRALVIAPTRELVVQITEDARLLGQATGLTIQAVYGGIDYRKQRDQVEAGVASVIVSPSVSACTAICRTCQAPPLPGAAGDGNASSLRSGGGARASCRP